MNLLANASKFGPADSTIRIGARAARGGGLELLGRRRRARRRRTRRHRAVRAVPSLGRRGPGRERARPRAVHRALDRRAARRHGRRSSARPTRARTPRSPAEGADREMKILLVDDDPDLLAVTGFALQQAGFLVVKAGDGLAALDGVPARAARPRRARHQHADGSTASTLARKLRERSKIPLIMLTARSEEEDVVRALEHRRRRLPQQAVQPEDPARARQGAAAPRRARGRGDRRARRAGARRGRAHAARPAARRRAPHAARGALPAAPDRAGGPHGADRPAARARVGQPRAVATGSCSSSSCTVCGRRSRTIPLRRG